MALTAYVLMETEPEKTAEVVRTLQESRLFNVVHPTRGQYSVIAVAEFPTSKACDEWINWVKGVVGVKKVDVSLTGEEG